MRRLVLVCMMFLLPVQWTWAAAAAYCAHEAPAAAAKHIGHHEHAHKSSGTDSSKKVQAGALDLDCEYCHLSAAQWLPALHDIVQPAMGGISPPEVPLLVGSHIGLGPERPDIVLAD